MPSSPEPPAAKHPLTLAVAACVGSALGAAAMALLDPTSGARRQEAVRRGLGRLWPRRPRGAPYGATANGAERGAPARQAKAAHAGPGEQEAAQLLARVHTALGQLCEEPDAIEVRLCDGVVELHGEVHKMERRRLVQGVRQVWGVGEVRSFLHTYERHVHDDGDGPPVVVH